MKYFKRTGVYKASNVTFNPETLEAHSYSWWCFVKKIGGKVIFNRYNYSKSTVKHQYKVRALLRDLGIKIDREVQCKEGLSYVSTIKALNSDEKNTLRILADRQEQKRIRRNEKAKERRQALKRARLELVDVKPRLELIQGGVA